MTINTFLLHFLLIFSIWATGTYLTTCLGIRSSVFWANRSLFCKKMIEWAIRSKKWVICSFASFLVELHDDCKTLLFVERDGDFDTRFNNMMCPIMKSVILVPRHAWFCFLFFLFFKWSFSLVFPRSNKLLSVMCVRVSIFSISTNIRGRVDSFVFRILENVMRNEFRILRSNPVKWSKLEEKYRAGRKGKKIEYKGQNSFER